MDVRCYYIAQGLVIAGFGYSFSRLNSRIQVEDFAQIFVDSYDWVNSLNYKANEYFPERPGTYVFNDVDGLGFELTISESKISIIKTPPKQPKPNNEPSFN